jgi:hypothetical protein
VGFKRRDTRVQVNLVLVLVLEALHVSDRLAARGQPLPLLPPPPASLNYACACLLPLVFLRRPPRRCRPAAPPQPLLRTALARPRNGLLSSPSRELLKSSRLCHGLLAWRPLVTSGVLVF